MKDVAERAGVSPVVVSRVLHHKALSIQVREETAERVRRAAAELGYRPNVLAQSLRGGQTKVIGVLHGAGFPRPYFDRGSRYFAALMDGIVEGAFKHDYSVMLCPKLLGQSPADGFYDGRFDGLVWYSTLPSEESRRMLDECPIPLVAIHATAEDVGGKHPTVICDNDQGIGLAVGHLVELGHRRIAFAYEAAWAGAEALARLAAFRRHMSRHGLDAEALDLSEEGAIERAFADPRHTALVTPGDGLAAEILRRAPARLSVVGFDSTAFCEELRPTLTSVAQPLAAMGETAIDLLLESIRGQAPTSRVFPCRLDVRGSTSSVGI